MKKLFYCLLAAGVMSSCSNEIDVPIQEQSPEHQIIEEGDGIRVISRAVGDEYDPISQLPGIVFQLKNQSNGYYLSMDNNIDLQKSDTYKFTYFLIEQYLGYKGNINGLKSKNTKGVKKYFQSTKKLNSSPCNLTLEQDGDSYFYYLSNGLAGNEKKYLKGSSTSVDYATFASTNGYKWEIIPDEEFLLNKITYDFVAGDQFTVFPKDIATRTLINNTATPVERAIEISETITETSTYQKVKGINVGIKISSSFKTGVPIFAQGKITTDLTETTNFQWTHGHTETQTYTFKETVKQVVPAYSTYVVRVIANEYVCDITYYAELLGEKSGFPVILQGRWEGQLVKETTIEIYDANERLLTSYSLPLSYE